MNESVQGFFHFFIGKDDPGDLYAVQSPIRKDNVLPEKGDGLVIAQASDLKHLPAHIIEHQDVRVPLFLQILKYAALSCPDASRHSDDDTLFH